MPRGQRSPMGRLANFYINNCSGLPVVADDWSAFGRIRTAYRRTGWRQAKFDRRLKDPVMARIGWSP